MPITFQRKESILTFFKGGEAWAENQDGMEKYINSWSERKTKSIYLMSVQPLVCVSVCAFVNFSALNSDTLKDMDRML